MSAIPSVVHFIWLDQRMKPLPYLAVRAALDRSGVETVYLHYDALDLPEGPLASDLARRPGLVLRPIDLPALLTDTPTNVRALYPQLAAAPARAHLLRLLLLWHEGGVYLDTDAIALRTFAPLLEEPGFAGLERIAFPAEIYSSRNPLRWLEAGSLTVLRDAVRRTFRDAGTAFRRIEGLYPLAANNAVLGAPARHPLVNDLIERIAVMDAEQALKQHRLGPQLLENATGNQSRKDFRLFPPWAFYPLPPEICMSYVRDDPKGRMGDRPHHDTFAAHVYASVLQKRLGRPLDAAFFHYFRGRTMLTRMVEPYLDDLLAITS
jgi:hypothetical protein